MTEVRIIPCLTVHLEQSPWEKTEARAKHCKSINVDLFSILDCILKHKFYSEFWRIILILKMRNGQVY